MVKETFIPDKGDIIWLDFNPQAGHEQSGKRPALVISPKNYNKITSLCILFPITSKIKGYPFEVSITSPEIEGVVLADQIKNLDWKVRNAKLIAKTNPVIVQEVIDLFNTLIT
jgi:mRNA interferase MazF